jgi:hypothetical protein
MEPSDHGAPWSPLLAAVTGSTCPAEKEAGPRQDGFTPATAASSSNNETAGAGWTCRGFVARLYGQLRLA